MHRQPLLDAISRYTVRHPDESDTIERFSAFIRRHDDCFERSLAVGHLTGSAWIVDRDGQRVLLTHHRKLNRWLQPGGHADGVPDILAVALQEAEEETGLEPLEPVTPEIFDLDIHPIPSRGDVPEHFHYDVRFAIRHPGNGQFTVSDESHDLAWAALDRITDYTDEKSILRMARKWAEIFP